MISCTEFTPCYSELFRFLEIRGEYDEVKKFWKFLFEPDGKGIPLITFVEKEGIRGCFSYWSGTLNEEAADFTLYLNEKAGWFIMDMHACPSKGRILALRDAIGFEPYNKYCFHCDSYRLAAEKVGLKYIFNFKGIEKASCSLLIYDPKVFDGRVIVDENTEIMDRKAYDNEYFHKDFHSSMNMCIDYLGKNYGKEAIREFLHQYVEHVYIPVLAAIEKSGLTAIEEKIRDTYQKEKAEDVLHIVKDDNTLRVTVDSCPAVKHLLATGRTMSPYYSMTTSAVMEELAKKAGCSFSMDYYEEKTGAAQYTFNRFSE